MSTAASSPARPRCASRASSNSSIGAIVGIGPPSSRMARRTAANRRNSLSMVSLGRAGFNQTHFLLATAGTQPNPEIDCCLAPWGLAQVALALARIMDNARAVSSQPALADRRKSRTASPVGRQPLGPCGTWDTALNWRGAVGVAAVPER